MNTWEFIGWMLLLGILLYMGVPWLVELSNIQKGMERACLRSCNFSQGHYILWDEDKQMVKYCLCFNSSSNQSVYLRGVLPEW